MLPFLARLLVYGASRDYYTVEDLLGITPPEGEMLVVQWKEELSRDTIFQEPVDRRDQNYGCVQLPTTIARSTGMTSGLRPFLDEYVHDAPEALFHAS
jgi:hypothetical protein